MNLGRLARTVVVASLALLAVAPQAGAVLSGWNGRIVFVSGRGGPANDDSQADIYLRTILSDTGLGSASAALTTATGQHRHPTWSPDRTKIAYAAGTAPNYDIFVLDLTTPGAIPQNITNSPTVPDDRPAWSPDGRHIAYESGVSQGSGQTDVLVQEYPVSGVAVLHLTSTTNAGENEGKPAWSPDSQTIYYAKGPLTNADIVKKPAQGGNETPVLNLPGATSAFQPSISPDGTKMCYTHGTGFNGTAEIYITSVSALPATEGIDLSDTPSANPNDGAKASYNCTWSPDGSLIAYVEGQTTQGDLMIEPANDASGPLPIESTQNHFDGNPDWAPDGTPVCKPRTVSAGRKPTKIAIDCDDTGPAYERTPVTEHISDPPDHGKLSPVTEGDPSTVIYTPNKGFSGTDTFKFNGFDAVQFAAAATVTIKVDAKAPKLTDLAVDPTAWTLSAGTTISFRLSEKAKVALAFQRAHTGRRVGGKCVKKTSANEDAPKCTRYTTSGTRTVGGKKGKNKVEFHGKVAATKTLSPGRYRVRARARDAAGNRSAAKTAKFRILKG